MALYSTKTLQHIWSNVFKATKRSCWLCPDALFQWKRCSFSKLNIHCWTYWFGDFNTGTQSLIRESWPNIYRWIEKNLLENQTFHDNAEKVFNQLPLSIRDKNNYKIFCSMTKRFFHDKGLTKIMYLWIIMMYQLHITFYYF